MRFLAVNNSDMVYAFEGVITIRKHNKSNEKWEPSPISSYYFTGDLDRFDYEIYSKEEAIVLYGGDMVDEAEIAIKEIMRKLR